MMNGVTFIFVSVLGGLFGATLFLLSPAWLQLGTGCFTAFVVAAVVSFIVALTLEEKM